MYLRHDLFHSDKQNLKVREHKVLGPYVDGLSKLVVSCYQVCFRLCYFHKNSSFCIHMKFLQHTLHSTKLS